MSLKNYEYILMDLDGTITDPLEGITRSVQHALASFGIQVEDPHTLSHFIGPPLVDAFMEYYGFSREQGVKAAEKYRERFSVVGLYENEVYPGMEDFLKKMTSAGKKLLVATSKPQVFAEKILDHFHLAQYFTFIGGSNLDGTRAHKDEVIAYVLAENHITRLDQVVMVGDRKYDLAGAQKLGLDCIGVLYGYGSRQEMETAGATALAENLEELTGLLLGSR